MTEYIIGGTAIIVSVVTSVALAKGTARKEAATALIKTAITATQVEDRLVFLEAAKHTAPCPAIHRIELAQSDMSGVVNGVDGKLDVLITMMKKNGGG